jgi:hypothetical protein
VDPQERTDRHPFPELRALKEPRGRSLLLDLARYVVICGWVRERKPLVNVPFYPLPWDKDSVSTTDKMQVGITDTRFPCLTPLVEQLDE